MAFDPDVLVTRLRRALAEGPPLRLAILFGSAARGTPHAESDVDVGIIPRDPALSWDEETDLQVRLTRACGRAVDLVRLDRASTLLRWEAARTAVRLSAEPPAEHPRFIASAAIEHADLMTLLAPAAERFRQRLAAREGAGGSGPAVTDPVLVLRLTTRAVISWTGSTLRETIWSSSGFSRLTRSR